VNLYVRDFSLGELRNYTASGTPSYTIPYSYIPANFLCRTTLWRSGVFGNTF